MKISLQFEDVPQYCCRQDKYQNPEDVYPICLLDWPNITSQHTKLVRFYFLKLNRANTSKCCCGRIYFYVRHIEHVTAASHSFDQARMCQDGLEFLAKTEYSNV